MLCAGPNSRHHHHHHRYEFMLLVVVVIAAEDELSSLLTQARLLTSSCECKALCLGPRQLVAVESIVRRGEGRFG